MPDLEVALRIVADAAGLHPGPRAAFESALAPVVDKAVLDAEQALNEFDAGHRGPLSVADATTRESLVKAVDSAKAAKTPPVVPATSIKQAAIDKANADRTSADAQLATAQAADVVDQAAVQRAVDAQNAAISEQANAQALP